MTGIYVMILESELIFAQHPVQESVMPANVDGMVREGISAYRAGRKDEARALLLRATEIDQYNEQAWLWLSAVVESPDEARTCLENVLTINPNNERARQGIETLAQRSGGARPSAPQVQQQAEDILASASFGPSGKQPDADELPSSIEWSADQNPPVVASSSISMNYKVSEPSKEEYDDWVSGLGIGNAASDPFGSAGVSSGVNPFGETDSLFSADSQIGAADDLFSSGPFSEPEPISPPVSKSPVRPAAPPVSPPPEKIFAEVEEAEEAQSPLSRRMNAASGKAASKPPADDALDLLDDLASNTDDLLQVDFDSDFDDDAELEKPAADELFGYIPRAIRATRLPGTNEGYPIAIIAGLIGVLLLNVGAIALFIMNLTR